MSAMSWTAETLKERIKEKVEVALTPDGRADSLYFNAGKKIFLQPSNVLMTMEELLQKLCPASRHEYSHDQPVFYLQSQNSNLTTTPLASLLDDLPSNITFAEGVLGEPEATNIWIGNAQSVTSTHRDPYENLYVVLRGEKTFTLWAPVEELTLCGWYPQSWTLAVLVQLTIPSRNGPHRVLRIRLHNQSTIIFHSSRCRHR